MADPNHWLHSICRFWTYCKRTWPGRTEPSQDSGDDDLHLGFPGTSFLGLLHANKEMPKKCRMFLGFVNILAVAIVVGLATETASPNDPHVQTIDDKHDQKDRKGVTEQDPNTGHGVQRPRVEDSALPSIKEGVETSEPNKTVERTGDTSKAEERTSDTSKVDKRAEGRSTASERCGRACHHCAAFARKCSIRLLTEVGSCGFGKRPVRSTSCQICGGFEQSPEPNYEVPADLQSDLKSGRTEGLEGAADQGESKGPLRDSQWESPSLPVQSHLTLYWRNRVLDILAPSLPPLPNLFHDSEKMNENGQNSGGDVVEGDQAHNELTRVRIIGNGAPEHDTAHATSHRLQDQHHAANNLETVLENEDNHAATHLARARSERMDPLRDEFRGGRNSSPPRVQIHLTASVLSPQTSSPDHTSGYPGPSTVLATRPATPPGADRNESRSNPSMPHTRSFVVIVNPTSAPTVTAQPDSSNVPRPDFYDSSRPTGTSSHDGNTSNDVPHLFSPSHENTSYDVSHFFSSTDDEIRSQSSSLPSSRSYRPLSTPVPSSRPRLPLTSNAPRERFRPRGRVLARRPRCGLRMIKALRDDPSCIPEEGKANRQPGRDDKLFSPKRGDVICRHTVAPGRGVVEIYVPGIEEHLQDGDTLVRLKMDNVSYPTMLILSAKAYLFLQGKWMYLGRHQHGVRKPNKGRPPG